MVNTQELPSPSKLSMRSTMTVLPLPANQSFIIEAGNKSYKHQYANIYYMRLQMLKTVVETKAKQRWAKLEGSPILIPRVLEVQKSQLCYIIGTVYMDMSLKPNVLEDIARDHSIPPPPPLKKFFSPEDNIMLEDESGRIRLVGERAIKAKLVTGVIAGVLGMETPSGEFEVVDLCFAGMAPHKIGEENHMDVDEVNSASSSSIPSDEWIAIVSGLEIGPTSTSDAQIQMLVEYLTGEAGSPDAQVSSAQISRLIIAGNSFEAMGTGEYDGSGKKPQRYGYDATTFSPHPTIQLSAHILDLASSMPVHLLPGATDPSGTILPQQPFPRAMFGAASAVETFTCETNPTYIHLESASEVSLLSRSLLVNSGQPLDDMFKYLPSLPSTRVSLAESTLRWRHVAPTAPDTLWCHPFFSKDPFVIQETPDLYIVGNQPRFKTKMVSSQSSDKEADGNQRCRIVLVPVFAESGVLVLVNMRTLRVKTISFAVERMNDPGVKVEVKEEEA